MMIKASPAKRAMFDQYDPVMEEGTTSVVPTEKKLTPEEFFDQLTSIHPQGTRQWHYNQLLDMSRDNVRSMMDALKSRTFIDNWDNERLMLTITRVDAAPAIPDPPEPPRSRTIRSWV